MAAPVRHRMKVRRKRRPTPADSAVICGYAYQAVCTCGVAGEVRAARRAAQADLTRHEQSLPKVPASERCRHPRDHDCKPWEVCRLCAGQLSLDLGD
jgi:hypothetical protein